MLISPKTTDLCDANDQILACATQFRSFGQQRAFAGNIQTICCFEDIGLMREQVNSPGEGRVLVIDGGGSLARALFGDVMADIATKNGWTGLVINGAIRDCLEIDAMDIGVKALGTVSRRGEKTGKGQVGLPVTFGGITFTPGARLVADEDGVVVLPAGLMESDIQIDDAVAATAAYAVVGSQ